MNQYPEKQVMEVSLGRSINVSAYPKEMLNLNQNNHSSDYNKFTGQYEPKLEYTISISNEYIQLFWWLKDFKKQYEEEERLRKEYPAVKDQYDAYRAMLKIVKGSESEDNNT